MDILLNGILRLVILTSVMFTHVCEGQEITGPTPATQAIINGTTHRLTCSRSSGTPNMISWFKSPNFNLFLGTQKLVFDEQFDNFGVEQVNTDQLDLVITDMIIEDAGGYYCQLAGTVTISDTATRTVEVEVDSMKMMIDGIEVSPPIDVIEDVASEVVCEAKGARPAVDIEWFEIKDNIQAPITSGFDQTSGSTDGGDTFDTLSTLSYITNKDYNGGTLKCITTGQDVASPKTKEASLAVQYKPDVTVSWNDPIVICSSDANPEVVDSNDFVIIANGIDAYTPEFKDGSSRLQLNIEENTHIRCNVTNSIGMGTADTIAVPGTPTQGPPPPTNTGMPKPPDVDLTFNLSTLCTSNPPSNDADIVITVDGIPVAMDSEITLPSSGCVTVECTAMKDSLTYSRTSDVCTNIKPTSGAPVAAVAVPLALIASASIAFAIAVIFWARRSIKRQTDKDQIQFKMQNPPQPVTAAGLNPPQTYMELNTQTREKQQAYEEPQPRSPGAQSPTYEDIAEDVGSKNRVYQELGDNSKKGEQLKEYVNIKPTTKARQAKRK